MEIPARLLTMTGQWAKSAATEIAIPPVSGAAYRNVSLSVAEIETGQPYDKVFDSSKYNEVLHQVTGLAQLLERYGILPYSEKTNYAEGARCLGLDGIVYIAAQASGPGVTGGPRAPGNAAYWTIDPAEALQQELPELWAAIEALRRLVDESGVDLQPLWDAITSLQQAVADLGGGGSGGDGGGGETGGGLTLAQLRAVFQPIACSSANIPGALMYITPDTVLPAGGAWMYYYWSVDVFSGEAYDGIQSTGIMAGGQKIVQSGHTNVAGFAWRTA